MKNVIKLSLIPEIETKNHAVLKLTNGAMMRGQDINGYDFECGNCETLLATGIFHQQIKNIVLVCSKCGKYNIVKSDWRVYVLKYIKEKVDAPAVLVGIVLIFIVNNISNIPTQTKWFLDVAIFIVSLGYKYIIQVFQEK